MPHGLPTLGSSSSKAPSQSSSSPLHRSTGLVGTQPGVQLMPSSMAPLQLSSRPLQISGFGVAPGLVMLHVRPPPLAAHTRVPVPLHAPSLPSSHALPLPGKSSSTLVSQSSSRLLHVS